MTVEDYKLRGNIWRKKGRIMQFGKMDNGKFQEGSIIYLDGNRNKSIYQLLKHFGTAIPTREQVAEYLEYCGQPQAPGIYKIESDGRNSVIVTKNIASSMAKVILNAYDATKQSDIFATRLARAKVIRFELLSFKKDYNVAARYAGLYDVLNPSKSLASKTADFSRYSNYQQGLIEGGNFVTLTNQKIVEAGKIPEFWNKHEIFIWTNQKSDKGFEVINAKEYNQFRDHVIQEYAE